LLSGGDTIQNAVGKDISLDDSMKKHDPCSSDGRLGGHPMSSKRIRHRGPSSRRLFLPEQAAKPTPLKGRFVVVARANGDDVARTRGGSARTR